MSNLKTINWEAEVSALQPYRRIVVVVDDTSSMPMTVRHAIRLAALSDAEVHFLAVVQVPGAAAMPDMLAITDGLIRDLTDQHQCLLDWAVESATYAGISSQPHVVWGQAPGTILYLADAIQCDLIIMGTPAQRGWFSFLQPSMAKRVAVQAHQPVLVIKTPCSSSAQLDLRSSPA